MRQRRKATVHNVSWDRHTASNVIVRVICWKSDIWNRPAQVADFLTYSGNLGLEYRHEQWLLWRRCSVALLTHFKWRVRLHLTLGHDHFPSHIYSSLEGTVVTKFWNWFMRRLMYSKVKVRKQSKIMPEGRIISILRILLLHWGNISTLLPEGSLPEHVAFFLGNWWLKDRA